MQAARRSVAPRHRRMAAARHRQRVHALSLLMASYGLSTLDLSGSSSAAEAARLIGGRPRLGVCLGWVISAWVRLKGEP